MAHQVSSPSSGLSSAQPQVIRVPPSISENSLDLNLSQAIASVHPKSVPKAASVVSTFNANGYVDTSTKTVTEQIGRQEHVQSATSQQRLNENSGATPNESPQFSNGSVKDRSLGANELTPVSAGKRKSSRVEAAARVQKELPQSGVAALEDGLSQFDDTLPSPGQKRKSPRVKQQIPDVTKKVILALEANEDEGLLPKPKGGRPRGSGQYSKDMVLDTPRSRSKSSSATSDAPSDLAERRLLLEERKMRLAEQRFALEEKKLDATIEIGKGLIISMERMTNTISGHGPSSGCQR